MAKCSQPKRQLNKKEREKLIQGLQIVSAQLLLKGMVDGLSEEASSHAALS